MVCIYKVSILANHGLFNLCISASHTYTPDSMDGASGVTQCPIAPGSKYIYNLTIPESQSGTFWYHAHAGISRADGLYGGFVVHEPGAISTARGLMADENRAGYDKEFLLLIGDWYHRQADQVSAWYMRSRSFGNEISPSVMTDMAVVQIY